MYNSANSFTGPNVVLEGTLAGYADSLGSSVVNEATVLVGAGVLNSDLISGSGKVQVGDVTFNAAQSYTGDTEVRIKALGTTDTLIGDFASSTGGQLIFQQNVDGAFTGDIAGNLRVVKQGLGILGLGSASASGNELRLLQGGVDFLSDGAIGSGLLLVDTPNPVTIQATGNRNIASMPQFLTPVSFIGSGDLRFNNGTNKTLATTITHNSTGTTQIDGRFTLTPTGSLVVNSGQLVLGDPAMAGGFAASGSLVLNGGTLTARNLGYLSIGNVTLAGGTLNVPGGYALPLGSVLQGRGGLTGRIAAVEGSTILASGQLTLGDATHPAGIALQGELYTGVHQVTLLDANQAVLGSYTRLGEASADGTLTSANGLLLQLGRSIAGRGRIESANLAAKAVTINGDVEGESAANPLELTGFVTGSGNMDKVVFSGTYSPGTGTALTSIGDATLTSAATLRMEIGGSIQGVYHDALAFAGSLNLGGTLQVALIDSYKPRANDEFHLFQGTTLGTFAAFAFPSLEPGLEWDASYLYQNGVLRVGLQGDFDSDSDVDGADFLTWQRGLGEIYDAMDLSQWQSQFATPLVAAALPVPETSALSLIAPIMLLAWRRKAS
ncbi:MAG: hypothetical protein H0T51_19700 [Pirellulales bacterium]|nr:hypothetical protein [Pirellulales bacterium]